MCYVLFVYHNIFVSICLSTVYVNEITLGNWKQKNLKKCKYKEINLKKNYEIYHVDLCIDYKANLSSLCSGSFQITLENIIIRFYTNF